MSTLQTRFDIWWNSPEVKQKLGAAYSLGASVVIIGAMFKILHLPGAAQMLGIGMSVEAFLFALGIFDQPHKEFDWDKVFDFEAGEPLSIAGLAKGNGSEVSTTKGSSKNASKVTAIETDNVSNEVSRTSSPVASSNISNAIGLNYTAAISDEDVKKLSDGIRNLAHTAEQFSGLTDVFGSTELFAKNMEGASTNVLSSSEKFVSNIDGVSTNVASATEKFTKNIDSASVNVVGASEHFAKNIDGAALNVVGVSEKFAKSIDGASSNFVGATDQLVKNIDGASQSAGNFIKSQESLTGATGLLTNSYQGVADGMEIVEKNTKQYAVKVEEINKNLSSINSIYEIQLKNILAQSEGLTQQAESVRTVTDELNVIVGDVKKMRSATSVAAEETENFKSSTVKLAKQVADLNQVYGNMLNALS